MEGFPKQLELAGRPLSLRLMTDEDGHRVLAFARELPPHDLLFLRRDITKQTGVDAWIRDLREGNIHTILAEDAEGLLGYSSLYRNDFDWSRHVAELRVLVAARGRQWGVGRLLTREAFALGLSLEVEKIFARATLDQIPARTVLEELGMRPEALLKNEVKDRDGKLHDVLVLSTEVAAFLARREAYGLPS